MFNWLILLKNGVVVADQVGRQWPSHEPHQPPIVDDGLEAVAIMVDLRKRRGRDGSDSGVVVMDPWEFVRGNMASSTDLGGVVAATGIARWWKGGGDMVARWLIWI